MSSLSLICSERAPIKIDQLPFSEKEKRQNRKIIAAARRDLKELRDVTSRLLRKNPSSSHLKLEELLQLQELLFDFCKDEHSNSAEDQNIWEKDRRLSTYEFAKKLLFPATSTTASKETSELTQQTKPDPNEDKERYESWREPQTNLLNVIFALMKLREGALRKSDVDLVSTFFLFWNFEERLTYDEELRDVTIRLINRTKSFIKNGRVVEIYDTEVHLPRLLAIRKKSM